MVALLEKFNDGGPFFTYPILIILVIIVALFINAIVKKGGYEKIRQLIIHLSWFAVAWGFLGRTFGLIHAFDAVAAAGDLTPRLLAEGLKMAILNPLFGFIVFIIARVFLIILVTIKKETTEV